MMLAVQILRTVQVLAHRKGIEVGRFILILVFFIPALLLAIAVLTGVVTLGTEGIPFARALMISIVCELAGVG